jgi:hypothetical protein
MKPIENTSNLFYPRKRFPRDDQLEWNGRFVDIDLEDQWLESLNDLIHFNLISICEGHTDRNRYPHINLRLKAAFLPKNHTQKEVLVKTIREIIDNVFKELQVNYSLTWNERWSSLDRILDRTLTINLISRTTFINEIQNRNKWFENMIQNIIVFDRSILANIK